MIFYGRPINEITDLEISGLVDDHVAELQSLEFKLTFNHRNDEARLEMLVDVASLANSGGGHLIIGIRDDGRGCAQRFEDPGDTGPMARSIRDLCRQYIVDRVDGLEVHERTVDGHRLHHCASPSQCSDTSHGDPGRAYSFRLPL
jgi:predicted HTH transcriptional regulator